MNEPCYYRISVKGLVTDNEGKILLCQEDNGLWELPGGGLEHREDPIEGLRREIHEETGLVITYINEQPRYFYTADRLNKPTYVANIVYEIKLASLDFKPSSECQALRFFALDEIASLPAYPNIQAFYLTLRRERDGTSSR